MARPDIDRESGRGEQGFTLLEVLIALVILGLALAVLFRASFTGVSAARTATRYEEAVSRAQSRLAVMSRGTPLTAGDWQGDDGGGYHWHARVAQVAETTYPPQIPTPIRSGATPVGVALYTVTVWISWEADGMTREVRLDTAQVASNVTNR